MGRTWHPEHFVCTHCQEEIGSRNFFERDGQPYCEKDYHTLFSPRCYYCNGPILDVSSWHGGEQQRGLIQLLCHPWRVQVVPSEAQKGPFTCMSYTARKPWVWDSDPGPMHSSPHVRQAAHVPSASHPTFPLWRLG